MANTPSQHLDRFDSESFSRSVESQWSALIYRLHMPDMRGLAASERRTAEVIADHIISVRGAVVDRARIIDDLIREQGQELTGIPTTAPATPERHDVQAADAWLKVIYRRFGEQEIQQMFRGVERIEPDDGNHFWRGTLSSGEAVEIDLQNPAWISGNVHDIRGRLENAGNSIAVGVNIRGRAPGRLPTAVVNEIMDFRMGAIEGRFNQWALESRNLRSSGNRLRVDVDMPTLLRNFPYVAHYRQADVEGLLRSPQCRNFIHLHDVTAGTEIDIATLGPVAITTLARRIMNRRTQLGSRDMSLTDVINRRGPIEQLVSSTADSKELMLALSMMQEDPSLADILNPRNPEIQNLERRRRASIELEHVKHIQNIQLPSSLRPDSTSEEVRNVQPLIAADIDTLDAREAGWLSDTATHKIAIDADEQALRQWEADKVNFDTQFALYRAGEDRVAAAVNANATAVSRGLAPGPLPVNTIPMPARLGARPTIRPALSFTAFSFPIRWPTPKNINSLDELREVRKQCMELEREIQNSIARFDQNEHAIEHLYEELAHLGINNFATAFPTLFPALANLIDASTHPASVRRDRLRANMNVAHLASEIEQHTPGRLLTSGEYTTRITELNTANAGPRGSEACWAIIRRRLENQGVRGEQLEKTLQYMRNQIQRTPEAMRDIQDLAHGAFTFDGDPNKAASKEWSKGKSFFGLRSFLNVRSAAIGTGAAVGGGYLGAAAMGGLAVAGLATPPGWVIGSVAGASALAAGVTSVWRSSKTNPLRTYQRNVFSNKFVGMDLAHPETARLRTTPLSNVMRAYFSVKYLYNLPTSDPKHLPQSQEVTNFLRGVHAAILERAQESFNAATGMSDQQLQELRAAGLNLDPQKASQMSITERVQAVHNFLMSDSYYSDAVKQNIERRATEAYKPVKESKEKSDWWKGAWKNRAGNIIGTGSKLNPLAAPAKLIKGGASLIGSGLGKAWAPLKFVFWSGWKSDGKGWIGGGGRTPPSAGHGH